MTDTTKELVMTRVFDAPRELVWRAFTDPDQFAAWFGPVGWSVPRDTVDFDVRIGGHQRFTMVNDEDPSMTSPGDGAFAEIVENELLVGYEEVKGIPGLPDGTRLTLRLEFHDEPGGKTRLVLRQGPFPVEMAGQAEQGWGSSFTKLDALLAR
ncbi:SRPBCC domain-containing protein [Micromonospora sp. NPDC126480]|uniref:SRPBCC family protein n=1 Tax=Micromonospora sp. NPDC126480 TaxID=3155312 RepID=UPI00331CF3C2